MYVRGQNSLGICLPGSGRADVGLRSACARRPVALSRGLGRPAVVAVTMPWSWAVPPWAPLSAAWLASQRGQACRLESSPAQLAASVYPVAWRLLVWRGDPDRAGVAIPNANNRIPDPMNVFSFMSVFLRLV
jgi:hypothetical protein